ncbi:MAG: ISKra4 family transposase, partial [Thiohalocapsa sp.]
TEDWPSTAGAPWLVAEMDGGMVPIVTVDPKQSDRRKGKRLEWKEAKLSLVHAQDSHERHYGGTLLGGVQGAGSWLFDCARRAGLGTNTQVHAVGDGASWLSDQVEQRFGAQGAFLVDFYPISEYLGEAANVCSTQPADWRRAQQQRLKHNQLPAVLAELEPYVEPDGPADAPVNACHRYLCNRSHQLDYQGALARGLPIGSGEIESAHRYVVQQRLKRPGAWWTTVNAERMLALRLNRVNNRWQPYWDDYIRPIA